MAGSENNIVVEIADSFGQIEVDKSRLEKMLGNICRRFGVRQAAISIAIVGEEKIRRINKQFLNRQGSTDVVSFDLSENGEHKTFEVVVNGQCAAEQAQLRGHKAEGELVLYVVHGLLHCLGLDDGSQSSAQEMHKTEDRILQQFGYGKVYFLKGH